MLIEHQIIKTKINQFNKIHYTEKGYNCILGYPIEVKAEDLTYGSDKFIKIKCDYCGKIFEKQYKKYLKQRDIIEKDACYDCFPEKQKEVIHKKYGVDCIFQLEDIKKKTIHNRITINGVTASRNQLQVGNYLNGLLNRYVEGYCVDIILPNNNIIVEYNGTGHYLSVKLGRVPMYDFTQNELNKINKLNRSGWQVLVIESQKNDDPLNIDKLKLIKQKIEYMKINNICYYTINL